MHTIEEIQGQILAALQASDHRGVCGEIEHYAGTLDELVAKFDQQPIVKPVVYVLYGGSEFNGTGSNPYFDSQTFFIVHAVKDLRGGADLKSSMNARLEVSKSTLIDNQLGFEDITPLAPVRVRLIKSTPRYSIYSFDVKTTFEMA